MSTLVDSNKIIIEILLALEINRNLIKSLNNFGPQLSVEEFWKRLFSNFISALKNYKAKRLS